ncbi:MAG TPA: hypothetical protein PLD23_06655 [Armatimonadota bacterium]|nr:hypothetical protein [Armatimonadota bacterium]
MLRLVSLFALAVGAPGTDAAAAAQLRDDGSYHDGGYWATPLPWFMVALMRRDEVKAARTFCDAVADFRSTGDINEWINDHGRGVPEYCASATMPLEGVRLLRAHLEAAGKSLPADLDRQLAEDAAWLEGRAREIVRRGSRLADNGVRMFTPDATGQYGQFWVRDWYYMIEGLPDAFAREEVRDGYLFLAAAQRADGCMPDRVRPDGKGVYSPGGEETPLSANGSTDQSPMMVLLCHKYWELHGDLEPFRATAGALDRAMRFTPRNTENGLVTITDSRLFRPWSFQDMIPLEGDDLFSSVLFWDACGKLAELYSALGDGAAAAEWRAEGARVRAALGSLWDAAAGAFVGASRHWPQPYVWGSAYAVYAGAANDDQAARVAEFLDVHYDLIVKRGQIRPLLKGTFWGRPEPEYVP